MTSSPTPRFPFAKAKLRRGRSHIDELEGLLVAHIAGKPVLTAWFEKYEGAQYKGTMSVLTVKPQPPEAALIFGDAIHNLRSALDHLINEVVSERIPDTCDLAFPFAKGEQGLGQQIRNKMAKTTPAERQIVRSLQPYPGGNQELVALHELDIRDKHRAPINIGVSVASSSFQIIDLTADGKPTMQHHGAFSPIPPEFADKFAGPPGSVCLGIMDEAVLEPDIAEGLPFACEPVIPTLRKLANAVEGVIARFETLP